MRLRSCDGCTVCCTVLAVPEAHSPEGHPCDHVCERGCAIYAARPESCRGFACGWAAGMVPADLRPDRCGVLQWVDEGVVCIQELEPGALNEEWYRRASWWAVAFTVRVTDVAGQTVVPSESASTLS